VFVLVKSYSSVWAVRESVEVFTVLTSNYAFLRLVGVRE
jgi:hypothetical protein